MTIPSEQFCKGMHSHQIALFNAFDNCIDRGIRTPRFFIMEWARRHRKTTGVLNLLIKESCRVPRAKYVYIAPTQVMARNIVWDDPNMLKSYLPDKAEMGWTLNEQKMLVKFANGSMLKVGGADEPDSLRGIDAIGAGFDEWALIKKKTWTEIFRPIIAGPLPPHLKKINVFRWTAFLYTPKGINHASLMFDNACCMQDGGILPDCGIAPKLKDRWFASRLDAEKAGIISVDELNQMKIDMPRALYDQEMRCSRITSEEMTLITSLMLNELNNYQEHTRKAVLEVRRIVAIDPAFGGDVCKIKGFENNRVIADQSIRDKHRATTIVFEAKKMAQAIGTKNFIVDSINDGGVTEGLSNDEAGYYVQEFKSSHKPTEHYKSIQNIEFVNKRAEAYFYVADQIRKLEIDAITSTELLRQLPIASRYRVSGSGKLQIIAKDKIKEVLGCSPDDADAYIMGIWGLQFVEPVNENEVNNHKIAGAVSVPDFIKVA